MLPFICILLQFMATFLALKFTFTLYTSQLSFSCFFIGLLGPTNLILLNQNITVKFCILESIHLVFSPDFEKYLSKFWRDLGTTLDTLISVSVSVNGSALGIMVCDNPWVVDS